jgi:hypothetical protein
MQGQAIVLTQCCESHAVTRTSNAVTRKSNAVPRHCSTLHINHRESSDTGAQHKHAYFEQRARQFVYADLPDEDSAGRPKRQEFGAQIDSHQASTVKQRHILRSQPKMSSNIFESKFHEQFSSCKFASHCTNLASRGCAESRRDSSQPLQLHQGRSRRAGESLGIFASCIRAAAAAT